MQQPDPLLPSFAPHNIRVHTTRFQSSCVPPRVALCLPFLVHRPAITGWRAVIAARVAMFFACDHGLTETSAALWRLHGTSLKVRHVLPNLL